MKVDDSTAVSIEYTMSFENGETIDSNKGAEPLSFVQGSHQIFEGLENALYGMVAGESKKIALQPEETYGPVNPDAIVKAPIGDLPADTREVGAFVQTSTPQGQTLKGQVTAVSADEATIDFNHPLAGKTLNFNITIISVSEGDQADSQ